MTFFYIGIFEGHITFNKLIIDLFDRLKDNMAYNILKTLTQILCCHILEMKNKNKTVKQQIKRK